ncbi:M24 family metallopeptidase [Tateyamaria omphalii]|uniref:Ectoine hydrolase DoeA n=1 Tax=Tateyamaria omphalii TaxID=299262 RepID=A0A1P8N0X6_9RHOB|nr:M24 family metallopeptidase [Tateyamaria omphalii]APX13975.1 ectoine hydrolase DoeA [Tateyamaria omphalii]
MAHAFEIAEYHTRLARVRAAMSSASLDCLLITDPSNMGWLTGYDGWSFYVHQAVIVTLQDDPVWWGRLQDVAGARRTTWMGDACSVGYAEHCIQTPARHPMEDLATRLSGRVGVEMDNYYYSAKAHAVLGDAGLELADATSLVNWCRAVKSEAEIGFMRKAARISEAVIGGMAERIAPGVPKNEVVADAYRDAIRGVDGDWGDYPAIVPLVPSGADAAAPHLTWNGDGFRSGEATTLEIAGCYRRYHAPLCRSVFLGDPPDDMKRAEAAVIEGLEAGIDAARAGHQARDVAAALNTALKKVGIERTARCGYPIGLSYPPDWGERTISFRADDHTVLEPNMTFHFMPGLWMEGWGLAITESIRITEDGPAECFCSVPRHMVVKP